MKNKAIILKDMIFFVFSKTLKQNKIENFDTKTLLKTLLKTLEK